MLVHYNETMGGCNMNGQKRMHGCKLLELRRCKNGYVKAVLGNEAILDVNMRIDYNKLVGCNLSHESFFTAVTHELYILVMTFNDLGRILILNNNGTEEAGPTGEVHSRNDCTEGAASCVVEAGSGGKPMCHHCILCWSGGCSVCKTEGKRVRTQYRCDGCRWKGNKPYLCLKHGCYNRWYQEDVRLIGIDI